jgi:hypothetical protein
MKNRGLLMFFLSSMLFAALSGCGGSDGKGSVSTLAASQKCIDCHSGNSRSLSPVTGSRITEDWKSSSHNTANGAGCLDCHSSAHYHNIVSDCRGCHATAHLNNGTSCGQCHGGTSMALADCRGCHATAHNDPSRCGNCHNNATPVDVALKNPDAGGKCFFCHQATLPAAHFRNMTAGSSAASAAMYVTRNYEKSCNSCHDPHKGDRGIGQQHLDWAKSGHGDVYGLAWSDRDFKGSVGCIRCHSATGFIAYLESGYTNPQVSWAVPGDKGREVLTCKACHSSYNFKGSVRTAAPFTAPYGIVNFVARAPMSYPNVGESNLCVPCHSGRENGGSIKKTVADFSNASFKNPHYLAAAAVFYGLGGFQYYSSASQTPYYAQAYTSKYGVVADGTIIKATAASPVFGAVPAVSVGDVLVGKKAPWQHGRLGMDNYITAAAATGATIGTNRDPAGKIIDSGNKGQCVACHLGPKATHTLGAFEVARATWGTNTTAAMGCYGCHNSENMEEVAHEERLLVDRTLAFFKWQLLQVGAEYGADNPYFYQPGTTNPLKNWSGLTVPGGNGAANMGAAMNYKLLEAEKGVHVHNRTFMKQLVFDSLQYLQTGKVSFSNRYIATNAKTNPNGLINFSAYSSALALSPDNILNPATVAASAGGVPGKPISITQLKAYITRRNTGNSGAIGSSTTPLYTRP